MNLELELDDINLDDIKTASVDFEKNENKKELELVNDDKEIGKQIVEKGESSKVEDKITDDNDKSENKDQEEVVKEKEITKLDLTWVPLNKRWCTKLMCNNFFEKDGEEGNGSDLIMALTNIGYKVDNPKLKRLVSKYINNLPNSKFYDILQEYRTQKQNGELVEKWNPFYVKTKRHLINSIMTFNFSANDTTTLDILSKAIGIDFIIFDNNNYNIIDLGDSEKLNDKVVILWFSSTPTIHYKAVGLKNDKGIQTIFKRNKLPREIDILLDKHTFLLEHIKELYGGYNKGDIKLNKIIKDIEDKLEIKLSSTDKKKVMVILRNWLDNLDFFKKIKSQK